MRGAALALVVENIGQHDPRALAREELSLGRPLAVRGAGNERDLSLKPPRHSVVGPTEERKAERRRPRRAAATSGSSRGDHVDGQQRPDVGQRAEELRRDRPALGLGDVAEGPRPPKRSAPAISGRGRQLAKMTTARAIHPCPEVTFGSQVPTIPSVTPPRRARQSPRRPRCRRCAIHSPTVRSRPRRRGPRRSTAC